MSHSPERNLIDRIASESLEYDREPLGRGGGQGTVYGLVDFPDFVYKRYHRPIRGAVGSFQEIVMAGEALGPALGRLGVTAAWPISTHGTEDSVEGYVMRRIPEKFRVTIKSKNPKYAPHDTDATLDYALEVSSTKTFYPSRRVTIEERLQIVRLAGVFLDTIHRMDFVYGDLSLKNLLYALDPVELHVMDLDSVHRLSTPIIRDKDLVRTPDWSDPESPGQIPLGFDLDRYRYSLLVYRMLAVNNVSEGFPPSPDSIRFPPVPGIDPPRNARLTTLLRRAAMGHRGSRPPISEWLSALEMSTG